MHTAKCKFNTNVLSLPPVTVVRNRLCFKGFGGGGEEGNQFPGWAWLWPCSLRADPYPRPGPRTYSASSTGAAWAGRPSWGHGVFGFVRSSGPSTAAARLGTSFPSVQGITELPKKPCSNYSADELQ